MENKDYVSLKVATILKEKGFDEYCNALYVNDKWSDISCKNSLDLLNGEFYAAPTLYQAQKWLRDKHLVHIVVDFNRKGWYFKMYDIKEDMCVGTMDGYCKTYEEALDNGIEESLNYL